MKTVTHDIPHAWWQQAVVYQIYPRSFMDSNRDGIGDLKGILQKIDYLKELGIDVIWLSPIFQSPNADNGYDISDYQDIMKEFGSMSDFDELLESAHQAGIKILLDLVVNHTSNQHPWFIKSREQDKHFRDYYFWRDGKDGAPPNNWTGVFGGSTWELDQQTGQYYLHLFTPEQPDLNWENPAVRKEIQEMVRFWLEKGVDGFRMDVINCISKTPGLPDGRVDASGQVDSFSLCTNGPRVHEYLQELYQTVLSQYDVMTVGETPAVSISDAVLYAGFDRQELNMIFQFEHMELDHGSFGKWSEKRFDLVDLKRCMEKWQTGLYGTAWNSLYWNNHDQPRAVSRFGNDQEYRTISAKMLAICLHMLQGTPYIYQGEELGMTNARFSSIDDYRDIETLNAYRDLTESGKVSSEQMLRYIHKAGRDNARTPMQWNADRYAGFSTVEPWISPNENYKTINAQYQLADKDSVFYCYQKLIQLRKQHHIIVYGSFHLIGEDHPQVFCYQRCYEDDKLWVVCNFCDETVEYSIPPVDLTQGELLIRNYNGMPTITSQSGQNTLIRLLPYEAFAILCTA